MSWSKDLWDQYDSLLRYSDESISCIEQYGVFLDRRSRIELDYARQLNDLSDQFERRMGDCVRRDERTKGLTWFKSLQKILRANKCLAFNHERVSDGLHNITRTKIDPFIAELRNERSDHFQKLEVCQREFTHHVSTFKCERKKYIDQKQNLKDCDRNLRSIVDVQNKHHSETLPGILQDLQNWDEKRSSGLQKIIHMASDTDMGVVSTVGLCLKDMEKARHEIDFQKDTEDVVKMYKTGYKPPRAVSYSELKDKMDTLFIDNATGVYECPKPQIDYVIRPPREIRRLPPYQQWVVFDDKVRRYKRQASIHQSFIDAFTRMIDGASLPGLKIREIRKQLSENNKDFMRCQKKINKYTQNIAQLERTFKFFSSDDKCRDHCHHCHEVKSLPEDSRGSSRYSSISRDSVMSPSPMTYESNGNHQVGTLPPAPPPPPPPLNVFNPPPPLPNPLPLPLLQSLYPIPMPIPPNPTASPLPKIDSESLKDWMKNKK